MDDVVISENQQGGTHVRNFMAHRGGVIVRESRPTGTVEGMYQSILEANTLILTIVKGAKRDVIYGVTLTHKQNINGGIDETAVHLDFDEIEELMRALDFIKNTATELLGTERDYTEVTYATKDNAKFGFFQNLGTQTAFLALVLRSTMFISLDGIDTVKLLLAEAMSHLMSKGAQVVTGQEQAK